VLAVAVVGGSYYTYSAYEAKTFNRLTGAKVTVWDAMFVKLVVTSADLEGSR